MRLQNVNPHAVWNEEAKRFDGLTIAATGQEAGPGEVIDIEDDDLFVNLCGQEANWAPADKAGHDFYVAFCDWVAAYLDQKAKARKPPAPPEVVRAFDPTPAPSKKKSEAAAAAAKAGE